MRMLFPLIIMLLIDLYVFQAVAVLCETLTKVQRGVVYSIYWTIPAIAIMVGIAATSGVTAQWPKSLYTILRALLFIAYISKFIAIFPILIDDIRRAGTWTISKFNKDIAYDSSRSRFLSKFAIILSGIPFGLFSYGIFRNPYRYQLHKHDIEIENLHPDLEGLKIVQISDIHSGSFFHKDPVRNSVDMVNKCKPDLVLFTGDLVNSRSEEINDYFDIFNKVEARFGVYSVLGNHDYGDYTQWPSDEAKKANFHDMIQAHKTLGWDLLMNENRLLKVGDANLSLIGVENYSALRQFPKYGDLKKAYSGTDGADLKILMSHDPSHWDLEINTKYKDIALTLAGHTHGFQFGIEIPGWIKWSPSQYMYKEWAGLYKEANQYLYVNRGLGFLGYPGRVGILPEITELTLRRKA